MRKIYIVYSTDAWLSFRSRDVIGICNSIKNCVKVVQSCIKRRSYSSLSKDDKWNLENILQTQGRENNFHIEEVQINELI